MSKKVIWSKKENETEKIQIKIADTFWSRMCGLLGTKYLNKEQGLLIRPCNSVHMFGMNYAIDVIYLDQDGHILKIVANLKPWQFCLCWSAKSALEVPAGVVEKMHWNVGDCLKFRSDDNKELCK